MYVALERYISQDYDKEWKDWENRVLLVRKPLKQFMEFVTTEWVCPPIATTLLLFDIKWDTNKIKFSGDNYLLMNLRNGNPSI